MPALHPLLRDIETQQAHLERLLSSFKARMKALEEAEPDEAAPATPDGLAQIDAEIEALAVKLSGIGDIPRWVSLASTLAARIERWLAAHRTLSTDEKKAKRYQDVVRLLPNVQSMLLQQPGLAAERDALEDEIRSYVKTYDPSFDLSDLASRGERLVWRWEPFQTLDPRSDLRDAVFGTQRVSVMEQVHGTLYSARDSDVFGTAQDIGLICQDLQQRHRSHTRHNEALQGLLADARAVLERLEGAGAAGIRALIATAEALRGDWMCEPDDKEAQLQALQSQLLELSQAHDPEVAAQQATLREELRRMQQVAAALGSLKSSEWEGQISTLRGELRAWRAANKSARCPLDGGEAAELYRLIRSLSADRSQLQRFTDKGATAREHDQTLKRLQGDFASREAWEDFISRLEQAITEREQWILSVGSHKRHGWFPADAADSARAAVTALQPLLARASTLKDALPRRYGDYQLDRAKFKSLRKRLRKLLKAADKITPAADVDTTRLETWRGSCRAIRESYTSVEDLEERLQAAEEALPEMQHAFDTQTQQADEAAREEVRRGLERLSASLVTLGGASTSAGWVSAGRKLEAELSRLTERDDSNRLKVGSEELDAVDEEVSAVLASLSLVERLGAPQESAAGWQARVEKLSSRGRLEELDALMQQLSEDRDGRRSRLDALTGEESRTGSQGYFSGLIALAREDVSAIEPILEDAKRRRDALRETRDAKLQQKLTRRHARLRGGYAGLAGLSSERRWSSRSRKLAEKVQEWLEDSKGLSAPMAAEESEVRRWGEEITRAAPAAAALDKSAQQLRSLRKRLVGILGREDLEDEEQEQRSSELEEVMRSSEVLRGTLETQRAALSAPTQEGIRAAVGDWLAELEALHQRAVTEQEACGNRTRLRRRRAARRHKEFNENFSHVDRVVQENLKRDPAHPAHVKARETHDLPGYRTFHLLSDDEKEVLVETLFQHRNEIQRLAHS